MSVKKTFWSIGDLCIYQPAGNSEKFALGFLSDADPASGLCLVDTAKGQVQLHPSHLYDLSPRTAHLVDWTCYERAILGKVDTNYFNQKLNKFTNVSPIRKNARVVAKCDPAQFPTSMSSLSWKVGDLCVCKWSENEQFYYAIVVQLHVSDKPSALVSFCYYDNEEWKPLDELFALGSQHESCVLDESNRNIALQLQDPYRTGKPRSSRLDRELEQMAVQYASAIALRSNSPIAELKKVTKMNDNKPKDVPTPFNSHRSSYHKSPSCQRSVGPNSRSRQQGQSREPFRPSGPSSTISSNAIFESSSRVKPHPIVPASNAAAAHVPNLSLLNSLKPPSLSDLPDLKQSPWQALLISWFMCGYHTGFYEALHSSDNLDE